MRTLSDNNNDYIYYIILFALCTYLLSDFLNIFSTKKEIPKASPDLKTNKLLLLHFCIALAAVNRSVVAGLERNLSFLTASCTGSGEELSLGLSGVLSCVAASLASLGLILEALLCIEFLLAGSKDKFFAAVLTDDFFVLIHLKIPRLCRKINFALDGFQPTPLQVKIQSTLSLSYTGTSYT